MYFDWHVLWREKSFFLSFFPLFLSSSLPPLPLSFSPLSFSLFFPLSSSSPPLYPKKWSLCAFNCFYVHVLVEMYPIFLFLLHSFPYYVYLHALKYNIIKLLVTFFWRQCRYVAQEPLLPMKLFTIRNFVLCSIISFVLGYCLLGSTIYLPVYFQEARGYSPTSSGLRILPLAIGLVLMSIMSGGLIARTGINYFILYYVYVYLWCARCLCRFPNYWYGTMHSRHGVSFFYFIYFYFYFCTNFITECNHCWKSIAILDKW